MSDADGMRRRVSMLVMVQRETPTARATSTCRRFWRSRNSVKGCFDMSQGLAYSKPSVKPKLARCMARDGRRAPTLRRMIARIGPRQPFRHFLREWRKHRGLTQQQLADRLETNKGNVANWENGKRGLTADVQFALAEALGTQPEDLFRDPEQPSADALLRDASPEIRAQAFAIIETLLKTAAR